MAWPKEDEYKIPGDIPFTRNTLHQVATKFNIYFLCILALIGGVFFLVGLITGGFAFGEEVGEPTLMMALGIVTFSLFFPFFMALYFGRHFLLSVTRMEKEIAELKARIGDEGQT